MTRLEENSVNVPVPNSPKKTIYLDLRMKRLKENSVNVPVPNSPKKTTFRLK